MPSDLLNQAIALCKVGEKQKAVVLLRHILRSEPRNETAWLWLADAQASPSQRLQVLREFQVAVPDSRIAQMALAHQSAVPAAAPQNTPPAAAPQKEPVMRRHEPAKSSADWRPVAWVFGGVILLGIILFGVLWFSRGSQIPGYVLQPTATLKPVGQALTTPPAFPTLMVATPTRSACDCAESLAYLERCADRIVGLQDEILLASNTLKLLPDGQADFVALSGWGQVRYDEQFNDQPPSCLITFHQELIIDFAAWRYAMEAVALGESASADSFIVRFEEKVSGLETQTQGLIEHFQQCTPSPDS